MCLLEQLIYFKTFISYIESSVLQLDNPLLPSVPHMTRSVKIMISI